MIVHRQRDLAARPLWRTSDLAIAASLAALLPAAWLLPERSWWRLCRAVARAPGLVDRAALDRTIAGIVSGVQLDPRRAADIALDLQAAVYELRMQTLRGWRPGGWHPEIALSGEEHIMRASARGNGVILWVAHFAFNSGITKAALHERGYRVSHLSRPEHGFSKTRFGIGWLNPLRRIPEDRWLSERIVYDRRAPAIAMRRMARALAGGEIVSITAGAWEGSGIAEGPLLGGTLALATGAPRLAALTGAVLLPVFAVRDRSHRFVVAIEAPIVPGEAQEPADRGRAAAAEFLARHEPWVRGFPEQWRGWKEWRKASPATEGAADGAAASGRAGEPRAAVS